MKFIAIILFIFCSTTQVADALEITFQKQASVKKNIITLGDVATFDEQSSLATALASRTVGQSPSPGKTIRIRSLGIKHYLQATQSLPEDITWSGSASVVLKRLGIVIDPDKVLKIIAGFIKKNKDELPRADITFIPSALPLPFTLPAGKLSCDVIPSRPGIIGSSRFSIIFRIDDRVVKNMSVRGKIQAIARVVVAAKSLRRGTILAHEHIKMARLNISGITAPGIHREDFLGKKLTRTIRAGAPILSSMVKALPVIRHGERVKIVIRTGSMQLSATGLAYGDGQINQMIRVQNLGSHKMIYCRVAAPGLVEVIL